MSALKVCNHCKCTFLQVDWIPARANGYCSEYCSGPLQPAQSQQEYAIQQSILTRKASAQMDFLAEMRIGDES